MSHHAVSTRSKGPVTNQHHPAISMITCLNQASASTTISLGVGNNTSLLHHMMDMMQHMH